MSSVGDGDFPPGQKAKGTHDASGREDARAFGFNTLHRLRRDVQGGMDGKDKATDKLAAGSADNDVGYIQKPHKEAHHSGKKATDTAGSEGSGKQMHVSITRE
jgi:hypothetical protein